MRHSQLAGHCLQLTRIRSTITTGQFQPPPRFNCTDRQRRPRDSPAISPAITRGAPVALSALRPTAAVRFTHLDIRRTRTPVRRATPEAMPFYPRHPTGQRCPDTPRTNRQTPRQLRAGPERSRSFSQISQPPPGRRPPDPTFLRTTQPNPIIRHSGYAPPLESQSRSTRWKPYDHQQ